MVESRPRASLPSPSAEPNIGDRCSRSNLSVLSSALPIERSSRSRLPCPRARSPHRRVMGAGRTPQFPHEPVSRVRGRSWGRQYHRPLHLTREVALLRPSASRHRAWLALTETQASFGLLLADDVLKTHVAHPSQLRGPASSLDDSRVFSRGRAISANRKAIPLSMSIRLPEPVRAQPQKVVLSNWLFNRSEILSWRKRRAVSTVRAPSTKIYCISTSCRRRPSRHRDCVGNAR